MNDDVRKSSDAEKEQRRLRETQWLQQIVARGAAASTAMDRIFEVYEPAIIKFCMGQRNLTRAEAEDVVQDVMARVWEKAKTFDVDKAPDTWIWAIVRNRAHDTKHDFWRIFRKHTQDNDDESLSALSSSFVPAVDVPQSRAADLCVIGVLATLKRTLAQEVFAVEFRHLEDWDVKRIAAYLGRSETATRQFLASVRKRFRPYFERCYELLSH